MKNCVLAVVLAAAPACASVPTVADANVALVAAQAVTVAVCAEPVPAELVESCEVLKASLVKAQAAAAALSAAGVK